MDIWRNIVAKNRRRTSLTRKMLLKLYVAGRRSKTDSYSITLYADFCARSVLVVITVFKVFLF